MTKKELKDRISELTTHIVFSYGGEDCGVDPLSAIEIDMWCGDDYMTATSVNEAMEAKFFDGKSLNEICEEVEYTGM